MKKKTTKKTSTSSKKRGKSNAISNAISNDLMSEIVGVALIGFSVLILASMFTNQVGLIGTGIKSLFVGMLGIGGYLLPFVMIVMGYYYLKRTLDKMIDFLFYAVPLLVMFICFFHLVYFGDRATLTLWSLDYYKTASYLNGGYIGALIGQTFLTLLGIYGSFIVLVASFGIWLLIATKFPILSWLSENFQVFYSRIQEVVQSRVRTSKPIWEKKINQPPILESSVVLQDNGFEADHFEHPPIYFGVNDMPKEPIREPLEETSVYQEPITSTEPPARALQEMKHLMTDPDAPVSSVFEADEDLDSSLHHEIPYTFPSLQLLKKNENAGQKSNSRASLGNAKKLEETLLSFGVEAKVTQIHKGPTVTRYELQPKQGVKVSKIVNLADDIALNLAASGIRIEAPIPGKAAVGIEVPNESSEIVYLRDVIDTDQFTAFPSKLAFALGKDIGGKPIVADIGKMPHILIAGATGSGKSVCINTLITSILYKASPDEVKLIMIDPKVVELNVYNGIPHLLIPVVTDPKKAAGALAWAVNEMTKRYQLFADNNVRDMKGFNTKVSNPIQKMPSIIIIIDELADLMMTAAKEVEDAICRLAQMARAAGIHLVIATQRPSVDVITGVIKANIPSRLAFAVSSGIDSRTILDTNGAEKLLGKGDMLFCPIGESKPLRIQGAFVSDQEVESIVEAVKNTRTAQYEEAVIESIAAPPVAIESGDEDELIVEAINLANGKDKLSISMLQRYFRIGFNRASRLMETLEARGIVGPDEGSKPRKVLNMTHTTKGDE
ncbi:MAG: DNA translocase FtsK 4TM domain-containing protein [Niameybacter sp.]